MTRARDLANGPIFRNDVSAPTLISNNSAGAEGGEIQLAAPATGSTISTGVAIDLNGNNFRIFERGGTNRGVSLGITSLPAGQGSTIAVTQNVFARQTSTTSSGEASTVNINTKPWNMPWGIVSYAKSSSNTVTSSKIPGLARTITAVTGRLYRISVTLNVSLAASAGRMLSSLTVDGNAVGRVFDATNYGGDWNYKTQTGVITATMSSGSRLIEVGFVNISGANTLSGGTGNEHFIIIEDIGPA
jgi:hypothetical protein